MRFVRDISISYKMLLALVIMMIALGSVLLLTTRGFDRQALVIRNVHDIAIERTTLLNRFILMSERVQSDLFLISVLRFMNVPDREVTPLHDRLEEGLSHMGVIYGQIIRKWSLNPNEKDILKQMKSPLDVFSKEARQATDAVSKNPSFGILLVRSAAVPFSQFRQLLNKFLDFQKARIAQAESGSQRTVRTVKRTTLAISMVMVFIAILLTVLIGNRFISRPVRAITDVMGKLADGDLSAEITESGRGDEIGSMARAVEVFRENAIEKKGAEKALKESEEKYRGLIEGLDEAIYRMSLPDGKYEYMSPAAKKIFGYSAEEFMENPLIVRKLMHPDFVEYFEEKWADLIEHKVSPTYKYKILDPEGNERWIVQSNTGICDDSGNIIAIEGLCRDITKGAQAEKELREREELHKEAQRVAHIGHWELYPEIGTPVWSDEIFRIFGLNPQEGEPSFTDHETHLHPDDWPLLNRAVTLGSTEGTPFDIIFRIVRPDGEIRWMHAIGTPTKDEKGKVSKLFGTAQDITDHKRAEEALRESEEKYRTVLESNPDPMVVYDMEGRVTYLNPAFTRVFSWSFEEQIGKKIDNFVPKENWPETRMMINKVTVLGESFSGLETRRYTKERNVLDISISGSCYRDQEGNIAASVINLRDITEQKSLEDQLQQAQKMEAIGTLAGGVAHDLNNILGGLVSYPELLLIQLPEESPLRKSILTIQKSGEKAAAVVQDLLTLARRGVVVTEVVNLNDVISEYLKSPEHENLQSYHPGVHLETHLEKDTLNILGSSIHLSKTVMNLVSNAAEAMPQGGKLTVSTENRHIDRPIRGYDNVKEGDYVVLTITDTGTGISPEDIEKIFEPFYTKKKMGRSGTGLGMAVVWGTVKDHNGYIDVQSTEGKGTTFTLYFPVTRKKLPEDKSHLAIESYSGTGESILIVDDVEEQRQIASGMLQELGYSVVSVSSGEEAVEYLRTNEVDLVLLDMIMDPGMDGLDTYKKILKIHPEQKAIIASGFSETDRVKELQSLGAGAYIRKPLLLEKIGVAVKEELEK